LDRLKLIILRDVCRVSGNMMRLIIYIASLLTIAKTGKTALHWGADRNSVDIVKLLLARGAVLNLRDKVSLSPRREVSHCSINSLSCTGR